ncbi:FtsX-like permease family protein [Hathewaya proteolytica DSM 3090]|uniref:FtsX-like permease family protein n=1 Tax=Hathewaya proteolytica DSM 3090 TaxID=1121331 RepID=A0A1M6NF77_9CLOT|nr:FtsX-like permease family protein [Hathewaya proteolytica]SHJ94309.1 FtsX-like permease family protein [Hathewaya proteolytica DSM 3090]
MINYLLGRLAKDKSQLIILIMMNIAMIFVTLYFIQYGVFKSVFSRDNMGQNILVVNSNNLKLHTLNTIINEINASSSNKIAYINCAKKMGNNEVVAFFNEEYLNKHGINDLMWGHLMKDNEFITDYHLNAQNFIIGKDTLVVSGGAYNSICNNDIHYLITEKKFKEHFSEVNSIDVFFHKSLEKIEINNITSIWKQHDSNATFTDFCGFSPGGFSAVLNTLIMAAVALLGCFFILTSVIKIVIANQTQEIKIMILCGAQKKNICLLHCLEISVISILSLIVSNLLFMFCVNKGYFIFPTINYTSHFLGNAIYFLFVIVLTILCSTKILRDKKIYLRGQVM